MRCPHCQEPLNKRGGKIKGRNCYHPREYQKIITKACTTMPRAGIWADMGLGKTVATLTALDILRIAGASNLALVVAPLRVAQVTWPDEAQKWHHLRDVQVIPILGDASQRERVLSRYLPGKSIAGFVSKESRTQVFTINYENLPWLVEKLGDRWPFDTVVADESTKLKGFRLKQGTQRAKALAKVAWKKIDRFIELTGTPSPNGLQDLWGQVWFLDAGKRLGQNFGAFTARWFQQSYDGFSISPQAHAQKEIEGALRDICISLAAKDFFDLQEPIRNTIYVDLPPKARADYKKMEDEMFMLLEQDGIHHEVEAFNAASRTMKCLQLASGAAYLPRKKDANGEEVGPQEWAEVHDAKIKALDDIVEEAAGKPVLVAYHFKSDLARLLKAFPRGRHLDKDPQTIRDWNDGKIPVLFAHPASAGHGLNLQDGGNILVFFSHNWNLEEFQQIRERIGPTRQLQAGHERPVFEHYIVARNTVDEMVMARRESKREVQDLLLEAMKHREF